MNKRELSKIERPKVEKRVQNMFKKVPGLKYVATASTEIIDGEKTLIMNFFMRKGAAISPAFRSFMQERDYISQDLGTQKTKWKTGSVSSLTGWAYWYNGRGQVAMASVKERQVVERYITKALKVLKPKAKYFQRTNDDIDTAFMNKIDDYQDIIKENRLDDRRKKQIEKIEEVMQDFGDIPNDYEDFVKEIVFGDYNFMIYSRKKKRAYCTRCGETLSLKADGRFTSNGDIPKHNAIIICPVCDNDVQAKSERMSRQGLYTARWSVYIEKGGENLHTRYFLHTKDFRGDYRKPKYKTYERIRTIHRQAGNDDYEWRSFDCRSGFYWLPYQEKSHKFCGPTIYERPYETWLYNQNIAETIKGTWAKYSGLTEFINGSRHFDNSYTVDWYLNKYRGNHGLEKIIKAGLVILAGQIVGTKQRRRGFRDDIIEIEDKATTREVLGLSKNQYRLFTSISNPGYENLEIIKRSGDITRTDFAIISKWQNEEEYGGKIYDKLADMREYTTLRKLDRYLERQDIRHIRDYFDYIRWMREMGYDLKNSYNLYPRDFAEAHDQKQIEYQRERSKIEKERRKKFNKVLKEMAKSAKDIKPLNLKIGEIFIRPPHELDELKIEGETLHHCVATYIDKVAKGETMIFFIRKESEPDKPYYTLEWKGRVIQCRGMRNSNPTAEVKAFVEEFDKLMAEYMRKKAG